MSPENGSSSPESHNKELTFEATELTLGFPGGKADGGAKSGTKRGFLETVDLNLGTSGCKSENDNDISSLAKSPASK